MIGGGFPESDAGERAILQAGAILEDMKACRCRSARLSHEVDDGGLIGWVHLVPPHMLEAHDAILAVDIGGTNVRCGIVKTRASKAPDLSLAKVVRRKKWRHAGRGPQPRRLGRAASPAMLEDMVLYECERKEIRLAPFIGIGCPGLIRAGRLDRTRYAEPAGRLGKRHLPLAQRSCDAACR